MEEETDLSTSTITDDDKLPSDFRHYVNVESRTLVVERALLEVMVLSETRSRTMIQGGLSIALSIRHAAGRLCHTLCHPCRTAYFLANSSYIRIVPIIPHSQGYGRLSSSPPQLTYSPSGP